MIREEFPFDAMKDYLYSAIDLLIAGPVGEEDRSRVFFDQWIIHKKDVLLLTMQGEDTVLLQFYQNANLKLERTENLTLGIPRFFKYIGVDKHILLLDLSSLSHVLIMFLTKVLIAQVVPNALFAAYIRPHHYNVQFQNEGDSLCEQIMGVRAIPGFNKRENDQQTLCAFIGFEGIRLRNMFDNIHNTSRLVPIVAFPSGMPDWYNITMRNNMDILQSEFPSFAIQKCYSESIFDAVDLLISCIPYDEKVVFLPLGTRPHSMACAIYATRHPNARILFDYAIESKNRAEGIGHIVIYHLSSFLNS